MPHEDGVAASLAKFKKILRIDRSADHHRSARHVRNLAVSGSRCSHGLYYAPDPSSPDCLHDRRQRCRRTRGGVYWPEVRSDHCITCSRCGFTIEGQEPSSSAPMRSMPQAWTCWRWINGSGGLLAVITEVTVKLTPKPELAQVVLALADDNAEGWQRGRRRPAAGIILAASK